MQSLSSVLIQCVCFLHIGAGKGEERETGRGIWLGKRKARMSGKFVERDVDTTGINWDMEKFRCRTLEARSLSYSCPHSSTLKSSLK